VEGISSQSERMGEDASDELEEEKGRVDDNHNLDASALGPRHLGRASHGERVGREIKNFVRRPRATAGFRGDERRTLQASQSRSDFYLKMLRWRCCDA
jgi:hypothetical protein